MSKEEIVRAINTHLPNLKLMTYHQVGQLMFHSMMLKDGLAVAITREIVKRGPYVWAKVKEELLNER